VTKFSMTIDILKQWELTLSFLVGFGLLFMGSIYMAFGFILIFNYFDLLGYGGIMHKIKSVNLDLYLNTLQYYRIIQTLFEITLLILIAQYNLMIMVYAVILHIFGLQDILYYIIGGYKFPTGWTWMYWTPIGWFWNKSKPIPNKIILLQALIGIIIVSVL